MLLWHVPSVSSILQRPSGNTSSVFSVVVTTGCVYMNGDVGKVPSGAVCAATPEPHAPSPTSDFSLLNGVTSDQLETYSDGGALPPCGQAPPENATDSTNNIPREQLKQMLSSQLEYYFSRENLANDAYLLSQMDNDQYVPIWTVANFNQVKKLTSDMKLITEVLRESPNVQVDAEGLKVRPNHKRCIVILREIPDSTPLEEVKALFSGKGCPKLISCEFAHNNSWYVTFENDDDAQKAYRFLREEVREFQGKPIMARIKAKPMNRLPIPPVGPGMPGLKNGYRTPPATAASASVYDPSNAFQPGQQRFLYTNGTSLPPNVNYASQVQIFPFYPPSMLPTWGHTSPGFLDFGSVFSVNGLTPQSSFAKTHTTRFTQRNRNKKSSGLEQRTTMSDSGLMRGPHMSGGRSLGVSKTEIGPSTTVPSKSHYYRDSGASDSPDLPPPSRSESDDTYRAPTASAKDSLPPRNRRRRKEDEVGSRGGGSPGPQFDLEADAFPPLPGMELSSSSSSKSTPPAHSDPPQPFTEPATSQWTESRTVPVTVSSKNCGLEKLSKTEEVVVNGNGDPPSGNSNGSSDTLSIGESKSLPYCPSTNVELPSPSTHIQSQNSSAHQHIPAQSQADIGGFVKLSYAQVAQHHHKEKSGCGGSERGGGGGQGQSALSPPPPSSPHSHQSPTLPQSHQHIAATAIVTVAPNNQPTPHSDDEKKETNIHFHPKGKSEVTVGRGRGGARSAPRRRDNLQRFNSRQRSPK